MQSKTIKYLDEMKDLSGVTENYQGNEFFLKRVAFQLASTSFSISLLMYSMSYLTAVPVISCRQPDNTYISTIQAEACTKIDQCKFEYELDNWTKKYDLVCDREYIKNLMLTAMFLSASLSNLVTAFLIDTIGRKRVIVLCTGLFFMIGPSLYFIESFQIRMILCGVINSFNSNFTSSNTILVRELTPASSIYNSFVVNYGFVFYSLGSIFIGLITLKIKSHETLWILIISIGLLMMAGNFFFYIESPIFLYKSKKEKDLIDAIEKYSEINGSKADRVDIVEHIVLEEDKLLSMIELKNMQVVDNDVAVSYPDSPKSNQSKSCLRESLLYAPEDNKKSISMSFEDDPMPKESIGSRKQSLLLSSKEFRGSIKMSIGSLLAGEVRMSKYASIHTLEAAMEPTSKSNDHITEATFVIACVILSIESAAIYFVYYGMAISIDSTGMNNIHANAVILGISSMFAYHYSSLLSGYSRISTKTFIYAGMLVCTILLIIIGAFFKESLASRVVKTLISMGALNVFVCCAFSIFYIYASEALPVTKRGLGIGISIFSGKLVGSLATYIKTISLNYGIDPVVGCSMPCLLAIVAIQLLYK